MDRECSIMKDLTIAPAGREAWNALKHYHYRNGEPGFIFRIYAIYNNRPGLIGSSGRFVGVIVYSMPTMNCQGRNIALGKKYCGNNRSESLKLLNKEMRCISRVVIAPAYRGIGLAVWLIKNTIPLVGVDYIEALAVMGQINPMFEKAGMARYRCKPCPAMTKLREGFQQVNIAPELLNNAKELVKAIGFLDIPKKEFIKKRMRQFASKYRNYRDENIKNICKLIVERGSGTPMYYLWERK